MALGGMGAKIGKKSGFLLSYIKFTLDSHEAVF